MDFNIDLTALAACAPAMSTEETRSYLKGVHIFERDYKIIYEATNGHFLFQVVSEQLQDDMEYKGLDIILPAFVVGNIIKKPFQKGFGHDNEAAQIVCHVDRLRINIEMPYGLINMKLIDGTFPNTSNVIPARATCKERDLSFDELGFNPSYMDKVYKSAKQMSKTGYVKMAFSDENNGPILLTSANENWLGVLMPARV